MGFFSSFAVVFILSKLKTCLAWNNLLELVRMFSAQSEPRHYSILPEIFICNTTLAHKIDCRERVLLWDFKIQEKEVVIQKVSQETVKLYIYL